MESFMEILRHPLAHAVLLVLGLIVLYFLIKEVWKFVIISILAFVLVFIGYIYFTSPGDFEEKLKGSLDSARIKVEKIAEKGKTILTGKGGIPAKEKSKNPG